MEDRLIDVNEVAALCGIGVRTAWRFRDEARMPAPIALGGCIRWRMSDIQKWICDRAPNVRLTGWAPDGTSATTGRGQK